MARVVLVTGVSRFLGGRLAHLLQASPDIDRVIGVELYRQTPTSARQSSCVRTSAIQSSRRSSTPLKLTPSCI